MTQSKIDKDIKNARIALERARERQTDDRTTERLAARLRRLELRKQEGKVARR